MAGLSTERHGAKVWRRSWRRKGGDTVGTNCVRPHYSNQRTTLIFQFIAKF